MPWSRARLGRILALSAILPAVAWVATDSAGAREGTSRQACTIEVNDDSYQTIEASPIVVPDPGVVNNDVLCGTDGLVVMVTPPSHGTLTDFDDGAGGFGYSPNTGAVGAQDTFTYKLEDVPNSPIATVHITIPGCCTTVSYDTTLTTTTTTTTTTTNPLTVVPVPLPASPAPVVHGGSNFTG